MRSLHRYVLIIYASSLLACSGPANKPVSQAALTPGQYSWVKLLDSAPWKKSYNFQMLNVRDTLWTFHTDGNWFSTDGTHWTKSSLPNAIGNLAFLDYVQFNDAIYGLGHFEGNIETFRFKPEIYRTRDLKQWQTISARSNLPHRFFYHPYSFAGKIWITGGEDNNTQYADAWYSTDAVSWTKVKDQLPVGKRSSSQVVALHGKLFLLNNDVWSSSDGLNWKQETAEILKGQQLFGYAALVYDNQIWLLGCNRNGRFSSQVLVSSDGKKWDSQTAPWSPRGGVAAVVYKNSIYITGGKYGGTPNDPVFRYSNDVWALRKNKK
jgi:hypothetical protein